MPGKGFITAAPFVPERVTLAELPSAVQHCKGCDLYKYATQAVAGEGPSTARVMLVGEQPGDREDREGRPFVGPAGRLLDKALEDAGIPRQEVYLTNAVKHFKFEERGKRRIHKKPSVGEIEACFPWLAVELRELRPKMIVCLGATAARAVLGKDHSLMKLRGEFFPHSSGALATATVHPSAVLRSADAESRRVAYDAFVRDLAAVKSKLRAARVSTG
ncbi:MAG TPA: UdgX family uracil-DNA binding protein [Candidatus Acidoferrum sp.]|nr:UdgX family uracil-DNA binding protein [Candidatus Acidoferrum sp.]